MSLILIVDDDEDVAKTIELSLKRSGHQTDWAANGFEALHKARHSSPDLIILDITMPEMDGVQVCEHLRNSPSTATIPILFLTASGSIESKIAGFNAGADDYLTKPFDLQELSLHIKALLRRADTQAHERPPQLNAGALSLNCCTFELYVGGKRIQLTPVEFDLMFFMMARAGQVLSAEQLLREVWQYPPGTGSPELVRAHIKNLRSKIEPDSKAPIYLKTVGRFGYTVGREDPPT